MHSSEVIHTDTRYRENRLKMLRMESFSPSEFLRNVVISIKESGLSLSNYFTLLKGFQGTDKSLSSLRSTLDKAGNLEGFNFVANSRLVVPCPTGFKENFHEYASILNQNVIPIVEEVNKQITLFNIELSQFITNKSIKISVRDNHSDFKALESWRKSKVDSVSSYFSSGNNQRQLLSKMFNNTPQIVSGARDAIEAFEKAYKNDPRDLHGDINTIMNKIDTIVKMAEEGGTIEVTPEAIRNVADKAFAIGKLVELLGVYYGQTETAAVLSSDILLRCLKEK